MKRSAIKKGIMIALEILLAAILVFNVATAVLSAFDLRKRLGWLPYAAITVQGGSMSPEMSSGDLVIVREYPYSELKLGDDVTFMTSDGLVTHRIVGVRDGEFITRGIANGIDDIATMGAEEYCGKVCTSIPLLGYPVRLLSQSYIAAVVCILLIFAICFASPIVKKVKSVSKGEEKPRSTYALPRRVLACVSALSILLCMPYMTDTKYVGQVNRLEMAVAQPLYFTSNYLAEGVGNKYNIQGWNGKNYTFNLHIRNYANELLFNSENVPVRYGLGIKMCTDTGYSDKYTVTVTPPADATPLNDFIYPESWGPEQSNITDRSAYEIAGGAKLRHNFGILVSPDNGGEPLDPDTKIKFEIYATTEIGKTYAIQLLGSFEMTVAKSLDFIGLNETKDMDTMVALNVKTNLISDGTDEKVVLFSWDPKFLYINEYESTAFNVINKNPTYFDKTNGRFWMKVQAYANINLEFFKKDVDLDTDDDGVDDIVPDYTISVEVVKGVGELPEAPPETPPATP